MADIIDFAKAREQRLTSEPTNQDCCDNSTQTAMLALCNLYLSAEEKTELMAAIENFSCYTEAVPHIQLLVDIYQLLEIV